MISGYPATLTVRARQALRQSEAAEAFNTDLQLKIQKHLEANETVGFEDFDIAQNPLTYEQWDVLFSTLQTTGVRVKQIRLFGCPTLDDNVATLIANWLSSVTPETCPYEFHISDCALTTAGFEEIIGAIEGNDAWPFQEQRSMRKLPMYMRIEGNYIAESSIQEKIDIGTLAQFKKNEGAIRAPVASNPDAKIKILVRQDGQFAQKQGVPPNPEDAPPPKPVAPYQDRSQQQWGQQGQWQKPQPAASWQPQAAKGGWQQRPAVIPSPYVMGKGQVRPVGGFMAGQGAAVVGGRPGFGAAAGKAVNGKGVGVAGLKGNAGSAADRSRTPPPKPKSGLPPDWEEHFSEEYGIPYYWNSKTAESAWEKPTA